MFPEHVRNAWLGISRPLLATLTHHDDDLLLRILNRTPLGPQSGAQRFCVHPVSLSKGRHVLIEYFLTEAHPLLGSLDYEDGRSIPTLIPHFPVARRRHLSRKGEVLRHTRCHHHEASSKPVRASRRWRTTILTYENHQICSDPTSS